VLDDVKNDWMLAALVVWDMVQIDAEEYTKKGKWSFLSETELLYMIFPWPWQHDTGTDTDTDTNVLCTDEWYANHKNGMGGALIRFYPSLSPLIVSTMIIPLIAMHLQAIRSKQCN
jgi:hypothetical protein